VNVAPIVRDLKQIVEKTNAAFRRISEICQHRLLSKARSHEEADGWVCKHPKGNGALSDSMVCCLNNCPLSWTH